MQCSLQESMHAWKRERDTDTRFLAALHATRSLLFLMQDHDPWNGVETKGKRRRTEERCTATERIKNGQQQRQQSSSSFSSALWSIHVVNYEQHQRQWSCWFFVRARNKTVCYAWWCPDCVVSIPNTQVRRSKNTHTCTHRFTWMFKCMHLYNFVDGEEEIIDQKRDERERKRRRTM